MAFRLLENAFKSQNIESRQSINAPQGKLSPRFLSSTPRQREPTLSPPKTVFFENIFPQQKKKKKKSGKKTILSVHKSSNCVSKLATVVIFL